MTMTYTIELAPGIEAIATRQAARRAQSLEDYLAEQIAQVVTDQNAVSEPQTGAELLALWEREGAFLPREDQPDSPVLARKLREQSQGEG
jgi:hypothetical protein